MVEEVQNKYLFLFEKAPVPYLICTADGSITDINTAGAELLGDNKIYLLYTPFINFVEREAKEQFRSFLHSLTGGSVEKPPAGPAAGSPGLPAESAARAAGLPGGPNTRQNRAETEVRIVTMEGRPLDVRLQGSTAEEKGVLRVYLAVTDITKYRTRNRELEAEAEEKETVIVEMNHRIKNNLNMISSAINLQKNSEENEKIRSALDDVDARIKAVELIHERIFPSPSVRKIDARGYLEGLLDAVFTMHNVRDIELAAEIDEIVFSMKRLVSLGLIVSELVTNALKYGFRGEPKKELYIGLKQEPEGYVLRVRNNGAPIPEDIDIDTADSLGLSLIRTLTGQLNGEAEIRRGNSTEVVVRFPGEPAGEEGAGEEPAVNDGAAVRNRPLPKLCGFCTVKA